MPVVVFREFKSEGGEAAVSSRTSKKGKKAPSDDEERSVEEVRMNNTLEDYGTTLTKLGQPVRQCSVADPNPRHFWWQP